ncbi:MAG TPA: RluA family pseudouridine synthase [Gaiellaceae bacterium]|nr:RluA family pseudouridine synthase [Gaiellaceae bacterium]
MSATLRRVPDGAAGERLDRFLAGLSEVGSRAAAERLLGAGSVLVDGVPRAKSHRLAGGEQITLDPDRLAQAAPEPAPVDVRIAYEDGHLLVVDKPAGLVVHPGAGHATGTLVQGLLHRGLTGGDPERPGIVHRLDRDTSGLLVVSLTQAAYAGLRALVRRRALEREYLALVRGRPRSRAGRIEAPIGRDRHDPTRMSLDSESPRDAVTHFEVVELLPEHALLHVRLETGRTHQIRVHLAAIGLPVAGDSTYGTPERGLERQFLHAARLAFPHPVTGAPVDVTSPLPDDLAAALERARLA